MRAKFELGQTVGTPGALEAIQDSGQDPTFFLDQHVQGQWGDVGKEDWQTNEFALLNDERLFSVYHTLKGVKLWVITEADRSSTTILLPEEY
jgi:hypothetical protein